MARLNVWQRAGVVASVLWFVGGGIWKRGHDVAEASATMSVTYRWCTRANPNGDFKRCLDEATDVFIREMKNDWSVVLATAIGPIVAGWVLAYVTLWIFRWIMAGRRQ